MPEEIKIPIKEKVKALMEAADEAYPMIFTEEHFTNFLSRMTTLYMSPNNAALLYSQDSNVSYVAGFNQWQNDYSRNVRRGQQSLKILAPSKYTFTKENPRVQPNTGEPVMDSNGIPVIDKESITVPTFKPVSVFDVAQTYGREFITQDTFNEEGTDWYFYMQALDNASSYLVDTLPDYPSEEIEPAFTNQNQKEIRVRTDIPTRKIYVAVIKQMAGVKYYENDANAEKDALTSELEIAGIAYAVNRHYGLPAEFTFDIEPWAAVQELDTLKQSLKDIKQTANDLITDIDNSLTELYQNLNKDFTLEAMDVLSPDEKVDEAGSKVYLGKLTAMTGTIENYKPEDRARMNTVKGYLSNLQNRMPDGELKTAVREASWSSTPVVLQNRLAQIYQNHLEYKGLLPDMAITQANARDYGYTYADMLPLQKERALELYDNDHDIFLLYDNDTKSSVSNREEIESFGGMFGIEREEWDASAELKQLKDDLQNIDSSKEMLLLYGKDDRFGIYQVKQDLTRDYAFESLTRLQDRGLFVDRNHYDLVYLDDLNPSATLDDIYEQFNIDHPDDYTGRSLSVSDIVVIRKDGETKAHYVDDFGFQEVPDFLETEYSIRNELQESAFKGTDYYLSIQESEDGYDYSIFDQNYHLKDGGLLNNPHIPMPEAVKEVAALHGLDDTDLETIDYDELMETTEQVANAILERRSFKPLLQGHLNTNEDAGYLTAEEKQILEERLSFMDDHMMAFEESYPDGLPLDVETDEIDRLFQEVLTNAKAQEQTVQGMENYAEAEIEKLAVEHAGELLTNAGYRDIDIIGAKVYGSRSRNDGTEHADLDVLIEYKGDIREDDFFNLLNNRGFEIEGIKVDMNPITEGKSGTIEEFLTRNQDYQKDTPMDSISFYVAESMEFMSLGEYIDGLTLPQAIEVYKKGFGKGNGLISGIGMQLHDGSMYDGLDIPLLDGGHVLNETINGIDYLRQSPAVQKALADIFAEYPVDERGNHVEILQTEPNLPDKEPAILVRLDGGMGGGGGYFVVTNRTPAEMMKLYDEHTYRMENEVGFSTESIDYFEETGANIVYPIHHELLNNPQITMVNLDIDKFEDNGTIYNDHSVHTISSVEDKFKILVEDAGEHISSYETMSIDKKKAIVDYILQAKDDDRGIDELIEEIEEKDFLENQEEKTLLVSMEDKDGTLYYTSFSNESTDEPVMIYDVYMRDTRKAENPKSIKQYMSDLGLIEVHNIGDILTQENVEFLSLSANGQPKYKESLSMSEKTQILMDSVEHWKARLGEQEKRLILDYTSHTSDFDHVILLGEELSDAAFEHTFGVMNPVISEEIRFEMNCLRENNEIYQMAVNIDDFINHTDPDGYKDAFNNKRQTILSLYQIIADNMPDITKHDLDKALLNLTTNDMPYDVYVKNGNELLTHLDKLETEKTPHQLAKDILEYTISITPEAVPKAEEQHEKEINNLASAFMRQQPDMLTQTEMLLRSAVDNQPDGTKAAGLLQRLTDMNDKILKKHMEPQVSIFRSEHPSFQDGQVLSLSSANKLMEALNKNDIGKQMETDKGSISNCNIYYDIAYLMDGDLYHYTGNQDISKGHGSMTDHIRAYAEQDLQENNFLSQAADMDSKNEKIETLLFCRDELAPYLEMHCNYADIKKSAQTALSEVCQLPDGTPFKDEKADYYAALVHHAKECHAILSLKDMDTPLPQMPQQEDSVTSKSPQSVIHGTKFSDKATRTQSEGRIASRQKQSILAQLESSKQEMSNARPQPNTEKNSKKMKGAEL